MGLLGLAGAYIIGGTINAAQGIAADQNQIENYSKQEKYLEENKKRQLDLMDLEFNIAAKNAAKNADKSDIAATQQENYLSSDINNTLNQFALQQKAQGLNWNMQNMQLSSSKGNSLVSMAASGTRSSSMAQAIDLEAAVNGAQMQTQQDQQRASDNYNLANLFSGLNQNINALQNARTEANDLRKSYIDGGDQYALYTKQRANTEAEYDQRIRQIEDARHDLEDSQAGNFFSRFFSGGLSGASTYQAFSTYIADAKKVNYKTSLNNSAVSFNNLTSWNNTDMFGNTYGNNSIISPKLNMGLNY